jgi:hypothetical protein
MDSPSLYPLKGIAYFLTHPSLWCTTLCGLLLSLIIAITSLTLGFIFVYPLQNDALQSAGVIEWLAIILSILFTLLETTVVSIILALLLLQFLLDALAESVFKLEQIPQQPLSVRSYWRACHAGSVFVLVTVVLQVLLLIVTLPLNALPVVGTVVYAWVNGLVLAWERQLVYHLNVKGWTIDHSYRYFRQHMRAFASFGLVAQLLQMVPVLGMVFMFTNAVGGALWSVDQWNKEERMRRVTQEAVDALQ